MLEINESLILKKSVCLFSYDLFLKARYPSGINGYHTELVFLMLSLIN